MALMDSKLPGVCIMLTSVLAKLSLAGAKTKVGAAGGLITTTTTGGGGAGSTFSCPGPVPHIEALNPGGRPVCNCAVVSPVPPPLVAIPELWIFQ